MITDPVKPHNNVLPDKYILSYTAAIYFLGVIILPNNGNDAKTQGWDDTTCAKHHQAIENTITADYNLLIACKNRMHERLEMLHEELRKKLNGVNGAPMEQDAYINTKNIIYAMSGKALSHWNLFPSPNGTFLLSSKEHIASINIGNNDFSYVAYLDSENQIKGMARFSPSAFMAAVNNINSMFGYEG
jgi:hypothetical protein